MALLSSFVPVATSPNFRRCFLLALFIVLFAYIFFGRPFEDSPWSWSDLEPLVAPARYVREKISPPALSIANEQSGVSTAPVALATADGPDPNPKTRYSRVIVMGQLRSENTDWIHRELPDVPKAIYVVDDPNYPLRVPRNRGHEAMVYLTYLISNYDQLPDIMIFIHAHQLSWHNNDALDLDTAKMVRRLSGEHVAREGYFNLRCHWHPGCPDWLHPNTKERDINKKEEVILAKAWAELHPSVPVPQTVSQPCCGQFAVSRAAVRAIPLADLRRYQQWLLTTDLDDSLSGRVWEYTWQFVFTGRSTWCPDMHACYCDGYGVCFESDGALQRWVERRKEKRRIEDELKELEKHKDNESKETAMRDLKSRIGEIQRELDDGQADAIRRGDDPRNRALAAGRRDWEMGDGF